MFGVWLPRRNPLHNRKQRIGERIWIVCGRRWALLEQPRVVVGTIHSVKGGQADVVYLFPDLSQAGAAQYERSGPPCDSVIRLFYVGVTRAREALYICQRETSMAVTI